MLESISYCPVLHARAAEMKALLNLPAASKDLIFPIIIARPWPNANDLEMTWEKISDALGNRRYGLDLDATRFNSNSRRPAAAAFDLLFDPGEGFKNYYDLVRTVPNSIPVLRIAGGDVPALDAQMAHVDSLDRGLILRLQHGLVPRPLDLTRRVLELADDVVVVIDVGWARDLLSREMWASSIIQEVTTLQPEAELVVCGSSFPDSFADIEGRGTIDVCERTLFDSLVRRHNAAVLVYGDWGSTRPPSTDATPMGNIPPRIDLPTDNEWVCFRRDHDEDYPELARRTLADEAWPNGLDIWGTYTIRCTADEVPGAIRGQATAAASRINIHLHRQAYFGGGEPVSDGDEPFVD